MANELARTHPPPAAPGEDDYRALCAALSESARGQAFLAEHARRSRDADTQALLGAIARLEARLRADASGVERLRDDLRMLLIAIRLARPQIDAAGPATQALQLAKLLDLLERRIDALAEAKPAALAPPEDVAPDAIADARAPLAAVPPPEQSELPIPSPASAQAPSMTLVGNAKPAAQPAAAPPPDPLAALMALSDDERLALFT
jgi:hypothetical protein